MKIEPSSQEPIKDSNSSISTKIKQKKFIISDWRFYGILLALISSFNNALSSTFVKRVSILNGSNQTLVRYLLQLITMIAIARYNKLNIFGEKGGRVILFWRGFFGCCGLIALYFSINFIDPSDSVALFGTNVIIGTLMARFFLKEKFNIIFILSVIIVSLGNYY